MRLPQSTAFTFSVFIVALKVTVGDPIVGDVPAETIEGVCQIDPRTPQDLESIFGPGETPQECQDFLTLKNICKLSIERHQRGDKWQDLEWNDDFSFLYMDESLSITDQIRQGKQLLKEYGVFIMADAFEPSSVEEKVSEMEASVNEALDLKGHTHTDSFLYSDVVARGHYRRDLNLLNLDYEDENLDNFFKHFLGKDARRLSIGLIANYPGSKDQEFHRDGVPLFPEEDFLLQVFPSYALTVFVPLQDLTEDMGLTEFLVDDTIFSPKLKRGDMLVYDYRVLHRGTSNRSSQTRRMFYFLYARGWFREHVNFGTKSVFE